MESQEMTITPVRQPVFANNVPIPQTTSGILEHTGTPFDDENITDVPPDFSMMAEIPNFRYNVTWPSSDAGVLINLNKFDRVAESTGSSYPWLAVPMSLHKFFNGEFWVRLIAVKPSRTPGKILVTYSPNGTAPTSTAVTATRARQIKKEWDLAQSNTFEMTIPGFNPNRMRNCNRIRRDPPSGFDGVSLSLPTSTTNFGALVLRPAMPYAPGSIFPDNFTIIVEMALQKAEFATPCDSHGSYDDFFSE